MQKPKLKFKKNFVDTFPALPLPSLFPFHSFQVLWDHTFFFLPVTVKIKARMRLILLIKY